MKWISHYQLFLFDFDGLLVDTENLHYHAYCKMCSRHGFHLDWSFHRYSEAAHHHANELRDQIYAKFPLLQAKEPNWSILYEKKKQIFLNLVESGPVPLMPGVKELLLALQLANIKRCVVTHSAASLIKSIRQQNPILDTIPHWITREDYAHPKPHPECYQIAISKWGQPQDNVIGFEDSPRGLNALLGTTAKSVLICPSDSPYLNSILSLHTQVQYYPTFTSIHNQNAPQS
jgi:beta-phosphoglucomutase